MAPNNATPSEESALKHVEDNDRPDTDWEIKIAKAKEARRAGQATRKGKPATLTSHSHGPA